MGCIVATARAVGNGITATATPIGSGREVSFRALQSGLSASLGARALSAAPSFTTQVSPISLSMAMTCAVGEMVYTTLPYIEATGTQHIDTAYIPNSTTEVEIGVSGITANSFSSSTGTWFLGARAGYLNNAYGFYYNPTLQQFYYAFRNIMPTAKYTTLYNAYKVIKTNATGLYVDGAKVIGITSSAFTAPVSLALCGLNNNGSVISHTSFKIHYCKIWDSGNLVRDYIPVIDKEGTVCMLDKVSGEFFYNQCTGEFIAGQEL